MIANKTIDPGALQAQAAALGGTHVGHAITCYGVNPTMDVRCDTGNGVITELCSTGQTALANYTPATVSVAPGANAGTGASAAIIAGSNDQLGAVTATAGTSPSAGDMVAVTFGAPRASAPVIVRVGALKVQAGTLVARNISTTGFTIASSAAPTAGNTYTLWYDVPL